LFFQFTDSEVIKEKEVFPKREPLSSGEEVKIDCNRDVIIAEPVIDDGPVAIAIIPRARLFPKAATPVHPKVHERPLVPEVEKTKASVQGQTVESDSTPTKKEDNRVS
jgi:hypothetical protein